GVRGNRRMTRLWDKGVPLDERVLRYTAGEDHLLDARLVPYDVRGSIAHAEMLCRQQLLDEVECKAICRGLRELEQQFTDGEWQIELGDEDVHTALESRLTVLVGKAGERLHLGRSRNDQVLTALRLYLVDAADEVSASAGLLCLVLDRLAERQGDVILPGYTHMQQALPSSVLLWSGALREALQDDVAGSRRTQRRSSRDPLGSAAGCGT